MKTASLALAALLLVCPATYAQITTAQKPDITAQGDTFYTRQTGEMRASKLIGTTVRNTVSVVRCFATA
jgi:hypothetical protein